MKELCTFGQQSLFKSYVFTNIGWQGLEKKNDISLVSNRHCGVSELNRKKWLERLFLGSKIWKDPF